jgi:beta-mannosidase
MKKIWLVFVIGIFGVINFSCKKSTPLKIDLSPNWQFSEVGTNSWLPAKVPGCVHTDLLNNSKIEDPYFGNNEQKLQWIEKENWEYLASFNLDENILKNQLIELVFEGLDTHAKVFLNDSLLLLADNMFREWTINCKPYLVPGENKLLVRFISPVVMDSINALKLNYQLPDKRAFTRKAPYQYGWDWGPRFVTSGIWKPVYFRIWNEIRVSDVYVSTLEITDLEATILIDAEIEATAKKSAEISIRVNEVTQSEKITLHEGLNSYKTKLSIPNPKRWWPNGMGDQPLYQLNFLVESPNSVDSQNVNFGIRKIELVQEKDSIGESFYFKINGKAFFAKGANYIPQDNFPARVPDEKYIQTIQTALDANMNMLRVWGGGIYEKDIFYDLCDQNGIMVWQDFMFACTMYPGDSAFVENVRQEAIYQVKRLRNHPSIALWCGNNEVDEGWHNWGWQKALNYSASDSTEVWNNYLKIFERILPEAVSLYSPYIPYIPSSPQNGWGRKESLTHGDAHYWGVWWGAEPFEIYEQKVGRFMSEYGFQGFPDLKTLDSCLLPEDRNLLSPALLNHQKHPRGMELIRTYMDREYKVPDKVENYAYVSQLVQAYGIKKAIEAHRREMKRCMGTLYWQLNDCWPVISWSSVDYYNRWKALHYFVRRAYQDVIISFEKNNDLVDIYLVSDEQEDFPSILNLKIVDFNGNIKWQSENKIVVRNSHSGIYSNANLQGIPGADHLLVARLIREDSVIAENLFYFLPIKDLNLPESKISKTITKTGSGFLIELTADKLAKNVCLNLHDNGSFSDNYFDLIPGETKKISCRSGIDQQTFEKNLHITTLQSIYK